MIAGAVTWAVRPDGGSPTRIARYTPFSSVGINLIGSDRTDLRRQLSADGRLLLLVAEFVPARAGGQVGIAVLDISTGRTAQLSTDPSAIDLEPAWSPDGREIAFVRADVSGRSREIWMMKADGSGRRILLTTGIMYGFTPDGKYLCLWSDGYACLELASGQLRRSTGTVNTSGSAISPAWRAGTPGFVGAFFGQAQKRIDVADAPGTGQRTIVRGSGDEARWRPGADEILYRDGNDLWLTTLTGTPRKASVNSVVRRAEWSATGNAIFVVGADAGVAPGPPTTVVTSLRRLPPDGTAATEIFRPPAGPGFGLVELATFVYH